MAMMNVWLAMARSQLQAGELDAALGSVDRALQVESTAEAWALKEQILTEKATRGERAIDRIFDKITSYEKAIKFKLDDHEWSKYGTLLCILGKQEEAIASYDKAIEFQPDDHEVWFNRGNALYSLSRKEQAIVSFDKAIEIKSNYHDAWYNRGNALYDLGRKEQAIASYDKAIEFQPDYHQAWSNRGLSLSALGRNEEAIASFDKAVEFQPDDHEAWSNRGNSLGDLDQYEEAIASYDKAIEFQPDYHQAWDGRGLALHDLGRNNEAVASYDKAIKFKPEYHGAWHNRGNSLYALGQYEEAIVSFEKAIEIKPDLYEAWANRGLAAGSSRSRNPYDLPIILKQCPANLHHKHPELSQRGYDGQVESLTVGLTSCPADSHSLGHGYLQRSLGDAHWKYAYDYKPKSQWIKALTCYNASEKVLTIADHPEERLQTLQRLVRVHLALQTNAETIAALLRQGTELRDRILTQAKSEPQRDRLHRTLPNFNELTVDLLLRQGDIIRAIEIAEADKNGLMQWLLPSDETPTYPQMQDWMGDRTVVYWHLSANALTAFILNAERDRPIVLHHPNPETALKQRNELETWIENWNKNYNTHLETSKKESNNTEKTRSEWQNTLETELEKLAIILDIPTLITHLSNTKPLILIPHRDLHRLPLPSFFPRHLTTTLPSIQLGRNLRTPHPITHLLNIPAPRHQDTSPLPEASLESIALGRLLTAQNIPVQTIANCNLPHLQTALPNHHTHLHFNGHAYYNDQNPRQSALALEGTDRLTVEDLRSIDLHHYNLITLASCETALTGNHTITAEYVGLVSALLSHRIPHILSTLWTVESKASALLILQFYRQLLKGRSPATALHQSQHWLQTLTHRKLDRLYRTVLASLPIHEPHIRPFIETECDNLGTINSHDQPYQNPYFWAAFILAGRH